MTPDLTPALQSWASSIARSIARRTPPSIEAADLVQVALLATWQAQDAFDPARGVPFTAYAYTRVRGAVLMSIRGRAWREATAEPLPGVELGGVEPECDQDIHGAELIAIVEHCLHDLPVRTAQAARWVWLYGQGTLDVALAMGVSRSTVYALLKAARCELLPQFEALRLPALYLKSHSRFDTNRALRTGECVAVEDPRDVGHLPGVNAWVGDWLEAQGAELDALMAELRA